MLRLRFYGTGFIGKTLWDWLNLLGVLAVPIVVGFGAVWFTTRQGKVVDAENKDNQREAALQAYINEMSELLLHEKLRNSAEEDEVRKIARVRTLTVLRGLDPIRKGSVLQFMYKSGLIEKDKPIIHLSGSDLSNAYLNRANLTKADLTKANLGGADLTIANLGGADLKDANLSGAQLSSVNLKDANLFGAHLIKAYLGGANLRGANLTGARITEEQLKKANSLQGATMPDGSIHP